MMVRSKALLPTSLPGGSKIRRNRSRRLPDIACLLFVAFTFLTVGEPLLFRSFVPIKNYILFALSLIGFMQLFRRVGLTRPAYLTILFFVVALVALAIQAVIIPDVYDSFGRSSRGYAFSVLIYSGLCFGAGCALPLLARSRIAVPLSLAATLATVYLFFSNSEGLSIWWRGIVYEDGSRPSHLSVDESVISLFFLAFSSLRSRLRYGIVVALLICLFLAGSRASIFMVAIAFAGAMMLDKQDSSKWIYAFLGIIVIIPIIMMNSEWGAFVLDSLFPRGFTGDASYRDREILLNESGRDLLSQFWIGDPTLIVHRFGSAGAYIHNLLSAWQFYGFLAFACVAAALIAATYRAIRFNYGGNHGGYIFGLILLLYAIMGVAAAKFVGVHSLWFALGYWSGMPLPERSGSIQKGPPFLPARSRSA